MLETRNVSRRFDGLLAVDAVSLSVRPKEIFGVIGPNGAGKTTFFNLVSGALRPTDGVVLFDGREIQGSPPHRIAQLGVGRTFQIVRPFREFTTLENVLVGLGSERCRSLIGCFGSHARPRHREAAREILHRTNLDAFEDEIAGNLPLGILRRLEIARALALGPKLILLDESFSGLSHMEAQALMALVRELQQQGMTVLLIEHNMQITMELCDRIAVLDRGRKIAEGAPAEISRDPAVISAYLGSEAHA